jgi:hypothetical protein
VLIVKLHFSQPRSEFITVPKLPRTIQVEQIANSIADDSRVNTGRNIIVPEIRVANRHLLCIETFSIFPVDSLSNTHGSPT